MSQDTCISDLDLTHFFVIIFRYWRALWAAAVCASFEVPPVPWQTATGSVDNCTRHWYLPAIKMMVKSLDGTYLHNYIGE